MKNTLLKYFPERKLEVIRNYISEDDLDKLNKLDKLNISGKYFNIGYVGTLNTGRNPHSILRLLNSKINNKESAIHFVGINDQQKEFILNLAIEEKLNTERLFFYNRVDRDKSMQYMKSFDGLILLINN